MYNKSYQQYRQKMLDVFPYKELIIYLLIVWPVVMTCLLLIFSGKVSVSYHGIGVDTSGRLYIGTDQMIEVYEGNELVNSISPRTSRGYYFQVLYDDTIIVTTGYRLDQNGDTVATFESVDDIEDIGEENEVNRGVFEGISRRFTAADGRVYKLTNRFGRTYAVRDDGAVLYKMPVLDCMVRMLLILYGISMAIFIPWLTIKTHAAAKRMK